MAEISLQTSKILNIHLELSSYPILSDQIRERMRDELYRRGVINPAVFEREVEDKAIQSQRMEGITDPYNQETPENWQRRTQKVRDDLTDFYFAYNLPHDLFRDLVQETLKNHRPSEAVDRPLAFNPELAPWAILFAQAEAYENYAPEQRKAIEHHLQEILVVITKSLVSDQLRFVGISRKYFRFADLKQIVTNRIGRGKIGGKSAGMLLAYNILRTPDPDDRIDLGDHIVIPKSYYLGADVFYDFISSNGLMIFMNQKYKPRAEIEQEVGRVREAYLAGRFPVDIQQHLHDILAEIGEKPVIVRSSSLLEDNFGTSFAGKYDSFFLPNQGTPEENLQALTEAIKRIYASVLNPETLQYREQMGLLDYDERMAILIQEVVGHRYKNYYFPTLAGVGFSRNPYRWSMKINPRLGFLRLVWGLGTRAVDRMGSDYPRMIALSHPLLRPENSAEEIKTYSQQKVDVIDVDRNELLSLPVSDVIGDNYDGIQYLVSMDKGNYLQPITALGHGLTPDKMVLTFDNLLKNTSFVPIMRGMLRKLERHYQTPVDIEFAVEIIPDYPYPDFKVYILQCRPLSQHPYMEEVVFPKNVSAEDVLFTANKWVTSGMVSNLTHIVYVDPRTYDSIPEQALKLEVGRVVSRVNALLPKKSFILLGPGRWGSTNIDLGVRVGYGDIYNTAVLGEIAAMRGGEKPEVSYGTHFFQDLVEARILPLALYPGTSDTVFNQHFLNQAENKLASLVPADKKMADYVKVIDVAEATGGKILNVVMDGEHDRAIGYFSGAEAASDSDADEEAELLASG